MPRKQIRAFSVPTYETIQSRPYAVLWRDTPESKTDPCPFCGKEHIHSGGADGDGHRVAHCGKDNVREEAQAEDGTVLRRSHGYIIRSRRQA
jgi:hypothetical protein